VDSFAEKTAHSSSKPRQPDVARYMAGSVASLICLASLKGVFRQEGDVRLTSGSANAGYESAKAFTRILWSPSSGRSTVLLSGLARL
jgi:hypothetical protein